MPAMRMRLWALALLASMTGGCSWLFIPKPIEPEPDEEPDCVASRAYPALDSLAATASLIVGVLLVTSDASNNDQSDVATALGVPVLVASVPYGLSAWTGFSRTRRCGKWTRAYARRQRALEEWERRREAAAGDEGGMCLSAGEDWTCHSGLACVNYRCVKAKPGTIKPKPAPRPALVVTPSPSPSPSPSPAVAPPRG